MTVQNSLTPSRPNPNAVDYSTIWQDSLTIFWGDWLDLRVRIAQVAASASSPPDLHYRLRLRLGSSVRPGTAISEDYSSYLQFILPGMVALSSMAISFAGTTFSICGERLYSKTFEEVLLLPIHPLSLHLGKMMAGVVRGLMTSGSVMVVAVLFLGFTEQGISALWSFLIPSFYWC